MLVKGQAFIQDLGGIYGKHCNDVAIDPNVPFNIGYESSYNTIFEDNYQNSIYKSLPIGTDLFWNIPPMPSATPQRATLILQSQLKTYVYVVTNETSVTIPFQTVFTSAEVNVIKIRIAVTQNATRNRIVNAINSTYSIDTTNVASNTGTSVRITNITGILHDNLFITLSPAIPADAYFGFNMVYLPVSKKIAWFNFHRYYDFFYNGNSAQHYLNNVNLVGQENKKAKLTFNYENNNPFQIKLRVAIKDNGFNLPNTVDYFVDANSVGTLTHEVLLPNDAGGNPFSNEGQIEIWIDDNGLFQLRDNDLTFSIDNVKLETAERLYKAEITDGLGLTTINFLDDNYVLDLSTYNCFVQIKLFESPNITYQSIKYALLNPNTCKQYIKLRWADNCTLIFYELYLLGFKVKTALQDVKNESFNATDGSIITIYKRTIATYEVRFHPYTENVQEQLEFIFANGLIAINNEQYYTGNNTYKVDELSDYIYTGRIDVFKAGTENIKNNGCCL